MHIKIVSDLHIGNPECTLVSKDKNKKITDGVNFKAFCEAAGKNNDYLILLGDVMDFAVDSYGAVFDLAGYFFNRIKQENITRNIVYVPGNHDYNIWDTIEYQANVINQLMNNQPVRNFKMSVPLIIDENKTGYTTLVGVGRGKRKKTPYGGMFLDYLIADNIPGQPGYIPFIIAYPNVYIITKNNELVFLTHGQYLEQFWSIGSRLYCALKGIKKTGNMKDFVAVNFPLNQLGSTGIGQAGPLTPLAFDIEDNVSNGKLEPVKKYINRLYPFIIDSLKIKIIPFFRWLFRIILISWILSLLKKMRFSDYTDNLVNKKDSSAVERFDSYLYSSILEFDSLKLSEGLDTGKAVPDTFIFGHTHVPVQIQDNKFYKFNDNKVLLINSGGWLSDESKNSSEKGALIIKYDSRNGVFSSVKIDV
jgi:predicted phosphodiesterase